MRDLLTDYAIESLQRHLEQVEGALLKRGRGGDDVEGRCAGIFGLHMVGDDRGEVAEQSWKTVHWEIVWSSLAEGLDLSRGGALGWGDYRGAQLLGSGLVLIVKQKRC